MSSDIYAALRSFTAPETEIEKLNEIEKERKHVKFCLSNAIEYFVFIQSKQMACSRTENFVFVCVAI